MHIIIYYYLILIILEGAKGLTIEIIKQTKTSLKIAWNEPTDDDLNGKITKYVVWCQSSKTVDSADTTMIDFTGLKPATEYSLIVQAFTCTGDALPGDHKSTKTNERGEFIPIWVHKLFHLDSLRSHRDYK